MHILHFRSFLHTHTRFNTVCTVIITHTRTTQVSIKVHVWVVLHTGPSGAGQLLLLHLTVQGAVCPIGEGGHAGLHAAAGPSGVRPPPLVLHHQQPGIRTPDWDKEGQRITKEARPILCALCLSMSHWSKWLSSFSHCSHSERSHISKLTLKRNRAQPEALKCYYTSRRQYVLTFLPYLIYY